MQVTNQTFFWRYLKGRATVGNNIFTRKYYKTNESISIHNSS